MIRKTRSKLILNRQERDKANTYNKTNSFYLTLSPFPIALLMLFLGRYSLNITSLSSEDVFVLLNIRAPRIILCMMAGVGLSVAGASLQSCLRNPLVAPYILGQSQGAAFGAALAMLLVPHCLYLIPASALIFSFIAVGLACSLARVRGEFSTVTTVLSGVIVAGVFTALLSIIKLASDPYRLSGIVFWTMGGFHKSCWGDILMALPGVVIGFFMLYFMRYRLNVLSMGSNEAKLLGVNINRDRLIVISLSTLMCSSIIAVTGIIAWIGLIVPHMARSLICPDNKYLIPASAGLGASLLLVTDTLCRTLTTYDIPVSIITTLVAAPYFIYLLRKVAGGWN